MPGGIMNWIIFTFITATSANIICDKQTYVYKQPGNITIAALIGIHHGEGCLLQRNKGLQLVQSLISAVEAVKSNNLLPGLTLGLTVYDTCSQEDMAQKTVISALVDAECSNSYLLGAVVDEETEQHIKNLTSNVALFVFRLTTTRSEALMSTVIARVLYEMHWMPVDKFFSTDDKMAEEFLKTASESNICIKTQLQFSEMKNVEQTDTVVIFSNHSNVTDLISSIAVSRLLLVPLDAEYQPKADMKSSKVLIMLPTVLENPALLNPYNLTEKVADNYITYLSKSHGSLQQLQTMSDVIKLVGILKGHLMNHCPQEEHWKICPHLPKLQPQTLKNTAIDNLDGLRSNLKLLRIDTDDFESVVLIEQTDNLSKLGSVRFLENNWGLDAELNVTDELKLCKEKPINESEGYDCSKCLNYNVIYKEYLFAAAGLLSVIELKQEAWVAALLSIASVGTLCSIAVAVFITIRICKKDMLEGNPSFSFLLLFSIVFMYSAILPFSFHIADDNHYYKGVFCGLKIFGTSLSYSLVFSTMLARSLMLASCDVDGGFMSHVNGYLQTVLFFFIAIVQIALTVQFWAINWLLLSEQQCLTMSSGSLFFFLLGYDMFLLLLLLFISPFIMKSKRNYQEGGYFSVSALLCLTVWLAWSSGYVLMPAWEEIFICFGLVGTATVILISVFIPRTYLMLTGIVRDHIVSTLPTLSHTTSTSVLDVNYRSTQALYDSVPIPGIRGNTNPNFYADRPTTPSTSKMEDDRVQDNTYERYETSLSPHSITRF